MHILELTGIDWREGRFISKLYLDQSIKIRLDQGGDKTCEDRKRRQKTMQFVTPSFYSTCTANILRRIFLKGLENSI